MKRCPITYEIISENKSYSTKGLHSLSPKLSILKSIDLTAEEQRQEALARIGKMSIQGVQKKLSARLKIKEGYFEIVDQFGQYILKPQSDLYIELPENEALSMSMAAMVGIEVPLHGLVYSKDNSMTYFIKRFDRFGHNKKCALEDFAQLSGEQRDTKYKSSMEKVIKIIEKFCTFPKIELVKFFRLTLFNFLIGNEDMHLKNFSLITKNNKVMLSPAYDLLNSTIAQPKTKEEIALPLRGKKNNLTKQDIFKYLVYDLLSLNKTVVELVINDFQKTIPRWFELINQSFLSKPMQEKYLNLLQERSERLELI